MKVEYECIRHNKKYIKYTREGRGFKRIRSKEKVYFVYGRGEGSINVYTAIKRYIKYTGEGRGIHG
jgi:hypothetical protein